MRACEVKACPADDGAVGSALKNLCAPKAGLGRMQLPGLRLRLPRVRRGGGAERPVGLQGGAHSPGRVGRARLG